MKNKSTPPVARLVGVIKNEGEPSACSLVFELETEAGHCVRLTSGTVIAALRFAQSQEIMAVLSEHWWARAGWRDGRAF